MKSKPVAPARFLGVQEPVPGAPAWAKPVRLYNLLRDIPGHPAGSTVSAATLKQAGFRAPKDHRNSDPRICSVCGKGYVQRQRKTCSARCGYESRKRSTRAPRKCAECYRDFWPYPSNLRRGRTARYCSLGCYRAVLTRRRTRICDQCGKNFSASSKKRRFCSVDCWKFSASSRNSMARGRRDRSRGPGWQQLAERIRHRDGYRCQRCGCPERENGERLSVDHIIPWRVFGDHEKADANQPSNLTSLCKRCHSWKTSVAEQRWLSGDRLDFSRYLQALSVPSMVEVSGDPSLPPPKERACLGCERIYPTECFLVRRGRLGTRCKTCRHVYYMARRDALLSKMRKRTGRCADCDSAISFRRIRCDSCQAIRRKEVGRSFYHRKRALAFGRSAP